MGSEIAMRSERFEPAGGKGRHSRGAPFALFAVILFSVTLLPGAPIRAGDTAVAVIVNRANPVSSMTVDDLRRYYSDALLSWPGGEKVKIFDLPMDDATRQVFSAKILGKAPQDVTMDWANKRITNTAKNPPTILKSKLLMFTKVAQDVNALGYISEDQVDEQKVKVILKIK
jgi:ABC-type phosphate transport system substrate-binding protein